MFKLKTITLEINSNATALDIQKLIKLLQPETMPLKKKKRKKTKETWDKAFSRCGNLALNLLRLSNDPRIFNLYRSTIVKELNIKMVGLNGLVGRINTCFWKVNDNKNLIVFNKESKFYSINSNEFHKYWHIFDQKGKPPAFDVKKMIETIECRNGTELPKENRHKK